MTTHTELLARLDDFAELTSNHAFAQAAAAIRSLQAQLEAATLADTETQSQQNFDSWMEEVGKIHNLRKLAKAAYDSRILGHTEAEEILHAAIGECND